MDWALADDRSKLLLEGTPGLNVAKQDDGIGAIRQNRPIDVLEVAVIIAKEIDPAHTSSTCRQAVTLFALHCRGALTGRTRPAVRFRRNRSRIFNTDSYEIADSDFEALRDHYYCAAWVETLNLGDGMLRRRKASDGGISHGFIDASSLVNVAVVLAQVPQGLGYGVAEIPPQCAQG